MRTQVVPSKKGDLLSPEEVRGSLGKAAGVRLPGKKGPAVL